MKFCRTQAEYDAWYALEPNQSLACVPTLGALHAGHASLIQAARRQADRVVVSIFVNPLQFGPQEDFSQYPRTVEQDARLCEELGVDAVFCPDAALFYPNGLGAVTQVIPPVEMTHTLCGQYRPGHFTGVATIVTMLLNRLKTTMAFFGEKDAQQLAIIARLVQDLQLPVQIIGCPIVREPVPEPGDLFPFPVGLALSSRNRYLTTPAEKQVAGLLAQALAHVCTLAGATNQPESPEAAMLLQVATDRLHASACLIASAHNPSPRFSLQYFTIVNPETLQSCRLAEAGSRVLIAAYVNDVRLIDNMVITGDALTAPG